MEKMINQAITAHQEGRLKEAEQLYRSILKIYPKRDYENILLKDKAYVATITYENIEDSFALKNDASFKSNTLYKKHTDTVKPCTVVSLTRGGVRPRPEKM